MTADRKDRIIRDLVAVRAKTLELLDQVPDELLRRRVHSFYSPIGWHFGHVGRTEEFWVCEALGLQPHDADLSFLFADLPDNPKDNRVNIPDRAGIVEYLTRTREFAVDALANVDLGLGAPLIADGYAWEFAIQHECQHQETIAEMLCLIHKAQSVSLPHSLPPNEPPPAQEMIEIPGGTFLMGSDERLGYDNEKKAHEVEVRAFRLSRYPVTAGEWIMFMQDGGYARRELWTPAGWDWRSDEGIEAPEYWINGENGWCTIGPAGVRHIDLGEPAASISWHEAEAFANWSQMRLPTEAEWEFAASGLAERRFPWGDVPPSESMARHGMAGMRPSRVAEHPKGASPFGCEDMAGNCWEWTSSAFLPYPGFEAFPYDGYSKAHMDGAHFVCRGGSWATAGPILRCSFRNWYVPTYRQGFLGMRLADD